LKIEIAGRVYRLIELGGAIAVHSAVCPHMGGPLGDAEIDERGCITCPWHGYRFDVHTGHSADGGKLALTGAPRVEVDANGEAYLRWRS
jgi:nitrite reductase/ring-hydroxylating ferredoxin subunit